MPRGFMLAADIGGTYSRFALFSLEPHEGGLRLALQPASKVKLATRDYPNFAALLGALRHTPTAGGAPLPVRSGSSTAIDCAALAVPGPVQNGHCIAPNIPWPLNAQEAEAALGVPVAMLNDFAAQGQACLFPHILGLQTVLPGESVPGAAHAVLGAGTGLGKAQILPPAHSGVAPTPALAAYITIPAADFNAAGLAALKARVLASEGGHALFPFCGQEEEDYAAFARRMSGRHQIIGDMAVTGYGLSLLYAFHTGQEKLLTPPEVTPLLPKAPKVLEWFARFYGRACRDFVLETLTLGGVYLSGGMLSHVPGLLGHPAFEAEFRHSESQAHLLRHLPVHWISNQDAGLWGSAIYGLGSGLILP